MKHLMNLLMVLSAILLIPFLGCAPASSAVSAPSHTMFWMNVNGDNINDAPRIAQDVTYLNANHVDLGVLAELNPVEAHDFVADAPNYGLVYSADPEYKNNGNGVFYDRSVWRVIGHEAVRTYSWNNEPVITEVPFLQDRNGLVVVVFPLHNPWSFAASDAADMKIEAHTVLALHAAHPAWKAVVAGDFNMSTPARSAMTHYGLGDPESTTWPVDQAFTVGISATNYKVVRTTATDHQYQYQFQF